MPITEQNPRTTAYERQARLLTFMSDSYGSRDEALAALKKDMIERGAFHCEDMNVPAFPTIKKYALRVVLDLEDYGATEEELIDGLTACLLKPIGFIAVETMRGLKVNGEVDSYSVYLKYIADGDPAAR